MNKNCLICMCGAVWSEMSAQLVSLKSSNHFTPETPMTPITPQSKRSTEKLFSSYSSLDAPKAKMVPDNYLVMR